MEDEGAFLVVVLLWSESGERLPRQAPGVVLEFGVHEFGVRVKSPISSWPARWLARVEHPGLCASTEEENLTIRLFLGPPTF